MFTVQQQAGRAGRQTDDQQRFSEMRRRKSVAGFCRRLPFLSNHSVLLFLSLSRRDFFFFCTQVTVGEQQLLWRWSKVMHVKLSVDG